MKYKKDALGTRMKVNYENRFRHSFPRRGYTLVRVDGKAFHTWTRGLDKPYDVNLMDCIDAVGLELCKQIMGSVCAFVQSDEISLLLTDFKDIASESWFDGNQSKIESVSASIATMAFNRKVLEYIKEFSFITAVCTEATPSKIGKKEPNATFDSRAWFMSDPTEVANYFVWRQKDAERNSLTMLASKYATHKELHGKNSADRHDAIHAGGDNWNNHPTRFKRGGMIIKTETEWQVMKDTPIFTEDKEFLKNLIPRLPE